LIMPMFFNLIGLGMLAISFGLWMLLATYVPNIGGGIILAISITSLFLLDVIYRLTVVRKRVHKLKESLVNEGRSTLKKDLNASLPTQLAIAITNLGGSLMLIPCWSFAILVGCFVYYAVS
jgi:hypothetical protein